MREVIKAQSQQQKYLQAMRGCNPTPVALQVGMAICRQHETRL